MRSGGARRGVHRGRRRKDVAGIRRKSVAAGDSIFALGRRSGDEEATETSGWCAAWRREPHGDLGFVPWRPNTANRRGNTGGGGALLGSRRRRCATAREAVERQQGRMGLEAAQLNRVRRWLWRRTHGKNGSGRHAVELRQSCGFGPR
jgi:hypothetical protein